MWQKIKDYWNSLSLKTKLIVAGTAFVVFLAKYRDVAMAVIKWSADRLMKKTQEKSDGLVKEENAAKAEANKLIQEANDLPNHKETVDEDWYKK